MTTTTTTLYIYGHTYLDNKLMYATPLCVRQGTSLSMQWFKYTVIYRYITYPLLNSIIQLLMKEIHLLNYSL